MSHYLTAMSKEEEEFWDRADAEADRRAVLEQIAGQVNRGGEMNSPELATALDEQQRCCVLDDAGKRCPQKTRFWVGAGSVDDYTHVCGDHVDAVKRPGDAVVRL